MSAVKGYLLSVSVCAFLVSLMIAILPEGGVKKVGNLIGALLMILAVVAPIAKIDVNRIAKSVTMFDMRTEEIRTGIEIQNRSVLSEVISERIETYILDKAEEIGVSISAEITLDEEGGYPYPVYVLIKGAVSEEDKVYLEYLIERDVGIPPERQEWR